MIWGIMKINHKQICIMYLYNKSSPTYTHTYVWDLFIGIDSKHLGKLEVPQFAICKLNNQENWWYNSAWVQGLRIGGWSCMSCSKRESQRTRSTNVQVQENMTVSAQVQRESAFLFLLVLFRPSADWMMPSAWDTQSTFSNAKLI